MLENSAWDVYYKLNQDSKTYELYDIYYKISVAIFKYRVRNKLTQKDLAKNLGVSQAMVSKLESGDYNYTVEQLWKIASKLGFDFDIVFQQKRPTRTIWYFGDQEILPDIIDLNGTSIDSSATKVA